MADNIKSYRKKGSKKNFYMFKAYLGTDRMTGKRIETTRRGFATKTEAKRALERLKVDYTLNGWHNEKHAEIQTFNDLFYMWIEEHRRVVKRSTYNHEKVTYEGMMKKDIGQVKLSRVTPQYFQKYLNDISKSLSDINTHFSIINMCFKFAVRLEIMDTNPLEKVVKPRAKKSRYNREENFYTREELSYFLDCVKKVDLQPYAFFRLLAYSGMRKGESLALTWDDVDFTKKTLRINKTAACDPYTREIYIQDVKTKSSSRTIYLDQQTINVLKQWQIEKKKRLFASWFKDTGFIFTSSKNELCKLSQPRQWMKKIVKLYPQKIISIHGFRHTHASLLFEAGASIKEVQARLGHAKASTTMDIYAHVLKSRTTETGEKFAKYMQNK